MEKLLLLEDDLIVAYCNDFKNYKKRAEAGDVIAQYNLALCYKNGIGVNKNIYYFISWLQKSAQAGNSMAQVNLAHCYQIGYGVKKSKDSAIEWYKKASLVGNIYAMNNLACLTIETKKNVRFEVDILTQAAILGSDIAQLNLGICYLQGIGVEQNYNEAKKWLTESANQNNNTAVLQLGFCYLYETEDIYKAMYYYNRAAQEGNIKAKKQLVNTYLYDDIEEDLLLEYGIDILDIEQAIEELALNGDSECQFELAEKYFIYDRDCSRAVNWYQQAAKQDNIAAQYKLCELFSEDIYIEKDWKQVAFWYNKFYLNKDYEYWQENDIRLRERLENAFPTKFMGLFLELNEKRKQVKHTRVSKRSDNLLVESISFDKPIDFYKYCIKQGNKRGVYDLAKCYANGDSVKQNYNFALRLFVHLEKIGYKEILDAISFYCYQMYITNTEEAFAKFSAKYSAKYFSEFRSKAYDILSDFYKGKIYDVEYIKLLLLKLYDNGDDVASLNLAEEYLSNSNIVNQDRKKAIEIFKEQAILRNKEAQQRLGYLYLTGYGVKKDFFAALYWLAEAADDKYDNGDENAQFLLGVMYYEGGHIKQDLEKAKIWFKKAKANGNQEAEQYLKKLS